MKLRLVRTANGFMCADDDSLEQSRKLKLGEEYFAEVRVPRNYEFLKKYFALIACAWSCLPEGNQRGFGNKEQFRKAVEVTAGFFDLFYSFEHKEWLQCPKSIAFDKMSAEEFDDLYHRVRDVIDHIVLNYVGVEEFERNLIHF